MAESSSDVFENSDMQRILEDVLRDSSCSCGCTDPSKINLIAIDHGELVIKYCSNCNNTFGLDDSFGFEELSERLKELGLTHTTLSPCNNCGNSDIYEFTYEGVDETGEGVLHCRICKTSYDVQLFQKYFENPIDSENIHSNIERENFEGYHKSDVDIDVESFCYLHCENCGNNNSNLWQQVLCDIDGALVWCLHCDNYYRIKPIHLNAKEHKTRTKTTGRTRVSTLGILKPGDHVEWHRKYAAYHHAIVEKIDLSSNNLSVIEYTGALKKMDGHFASVRRTILLFDPDGDMMFRIDYEEGGCLTNEKTLEKARSRLGEAKYNPFTNNCEHFATWCKTGKAGSEQASTIANRLARVATGTGLKTGEEIIQAGAMSVRNIPWKESFKIARHVGLKNAKTYGAGAAKVARNMKGGMIVLNLGINVAIEGAFTVYYAQQARRRYKEGKISKEDYKLQRRKLCCESVGGVTTGTIAGFVGQAVIPIPIVGAVVGSTLGNILGRHLGAIIGKMISEKQWKKN